MTHRARARAGRGPRTGWGSTAAGAGARVKGGCAMTCGQVFDPISAPQRPTAGSGAITGRSIAELVRRAATAARRARFLQPDLRRSTP